MLRVGLTGGIGSGKSEVSRRLAARGAVLIDADVAARQVVVPGSPGLRPASPGAFGDGRAPPGRLAGPGTARRDRLRRPGLRAKLNAIVHPLVRQWMLAAERTAIEAASREPGTDPGARS